MPAVGLLTLLLATGRLLLWRIIYPVNSIRLNEMDGCYESWSELIHTSQGITRFPLCEVDPPVRSNWLPRLFKLVATHTFRCRDLYEIVVNSATGKYYAGLEYLHRQSTTPRIDKGLRLPLSGQFVGFQWMTH